MKRALIIGASGGIGRALVAQLEERGVEVCAVSRQRDGVDFTQREAFAVYLSRLEPGFDFIFVASGALCCVAAGPEKSLETLSAEEMIAQFAVNTVGPALVLREAKRLLPRKGRSVFAVLSARVGSIEDNRLGGWYSYRASKAALNQVVRTGAIELGRSHKEAICVALHPGTVATEFTAGYAAAHKLTPEASAVHLLSVLNGLTPENSGGFYDWKGQKIPW